MPVTPTVAAITIAMGVVSGVLGAMLGIGGGVFLVPFLVLIIGLPFKSAAAVSLAAVIATSSTVTAAKAGRHLMNLRLGMILEVATAAGGLAGGLTAQALSPSTLQLLFAVTAVAVAVAVVRRKPPEERSSTVADVGRLGGEYLDELTGRSVRYRVQRIPAGLAASFLAGNLSTLLGVGGGIIKVPVLVTWCGVPMRVAAATSAFMIGVTATSGAVIYYGHGHLIPALAAAAIVGTQAGSAWGLRLSARAQAGGLRKLLAGVLVTVAVLMVVRAFR
jgi:uncharacterized membrane protein YfcA